MKKLVYYSVFGKNFCDLFLVSLDSLLNNKDDTIDILVICNNNDYEYLKTKNKYDGLLFLIAETRNGNEAAINKSKIYDFKDFEKYNKFLYIDSDTLIIKNINIIFDYISEENIYTSQGYGSTLDHPIFTIGLTDLEKLKIKNEKRQGISAGIFAFTKNKMPFFKELFYFIRNHKDQNLPMMDQPYFGTFILRNNPDYLVLGDPLHTPNSKNIFISNEASSNLNSIETVVILHFAGSIGNGLHKINIMKNIINKIGLK